MVPFRVMMVLRVCLELEEQFLQLPVCGGLPHPLINLLTPAWGMSSRVSGFFVFFVCLFVTDTSKSRLIRALYQEVLVTAAIQGLKLTTFSEHFITPRVPYRRVSLW